MSSNNEPIRIGQILIEHGVLTEQQVFEIIKSQKENHKPFGVLAEHMFDVTVESIEDAWVEQYARETGAIDLSEQEIDIDALKLINRRQAWQFEILPMRFESGGELLMAASKARLARAVAFVANKLEQVVYFRVAERDELRTFLQDHYPMPEISSEILERAKDLASDAA